MVLSITYQFNNSFKGYKAHNNCFETAKSYLDGNSSRNYYLNIFTNSRQAGALKNKYLIIIMNIKYMHTFNSLEGVEDLIYYILYLI